MSMIIREKALVGQMKEAYSNGGYTVAVKDGRMLLTNGYWIAVIEQSNVPGDVLGLLAVHIRDVPKEGQAFRVTKTKDGPMVQVCILENAVAGLKKLQELKEELGAADEMRRIELTLGALQLWQELPGNRIYMIDPRYSALFDTKAETVRLGNGIYAEGEISELWVLRMTDGAHEEKLRHLEKIPWTK